MIKNKFLIIFLISIAFVLLLTFNQKVSAIFQVESNNDDTTFYNLPDLPQKPNNCQTTLIVQQNIDGTDYFYLYYLCNSYDSCCFIAQKTNGYIGILSYVQSTPLLRYTYRVENNSWVLKANKAEYSQNLHFGYTKSINGQSYIKDILYSDKDIYYSMTKYGGTGIAYSAPNKEEEPFFRKPSTWEVTFKARELAEILPMVNKLVTILLPAGLGIFSVLLVISLIKSKKWRSF